ncbi:MAG: alpha-amylase family glycosyl hydrolase [Limisphaerales bacterium]
MSRIVRIHFDNTEKIVDPHVWLWHPASSVVGDFPATDADTFGLIFDAAFVRTDFFFKFKSGSGVDGPWEPRELHRTYRPPAVIGGVVPPEEIWCRGDRAFIYHGEPKAAESRTAAQFLATLPAKPGVYIPETGGRSGIGAHLLADGRMLFGLYHPNAGRVFLMGDFNGWQRPGHDTPDPGRFIEMNLYPGYFGAPNTWLVVIDQARVGQEYKFVVFGGVPSDEKKRLLQYLTDPCARRLGPNYNVNNGVIVDPSTYHWGDGTWRTPDISQLIIYELSVYGFTESDPDIEPDNRGTFRGITERIREGYFDRLGVTALSLMPLSESPSPQGPNSIGYDPSLYFLIERDFGSPDDLRELVDTAHQHGLAVLLDQVFNHTSSSVNPLWNAILEHPSEEGSSDGGLYFNGETPWGNRIATEKTDVQNMLIDACRHFLVEYHIDGFRFDATHTNYMDHGFVHRLISELKQTKPSVILIAENLPNQSSLNRSGFDGMAQWCDSFHDKIKAMLREGTFERTNHYSADRLADIFYFSRSFFAVHTNNVVNYCESHDEHSVSGEIKYQPFLNHPAAKDRKARLGLFATMVALGQPMIYMGQEFNVERERNLVTVNWPSDLDNHGFFQWASRLIHLRKRYPALRIAGYDPAGEGKLSWVLGPWMSGERGGGQRLLGWRLRPNDDPRDAILVMLNFEGRDVTVDVDFGLPGVWVKLADLGWVNDIPPGGNNSVGDPTALRTADGHYAGFVLPSSSGFLYKWEGF